MFKAIRWFHKRGVHSCLSGFYSSRALLGYFLLVFHSTLLAEVQVHLNKGEFDQSIVQVVGPASSGDGSLYVTKKYVDKSKPTSVKVSSEPKIEYIINDGDFVLNLATYPSVNKVSFLEFQKRSDGIIFLFLVDGKIDAYLYQAEEKSVERLAEYNKPLEVNGVLSSIDAGHGLSVEIPAINQSSIWLNRPSGNSDEDQKILLHESKEEIEFGISDTKIVGDRLFVIGVGRTSLEEGKILIWRLSTQYKDGENTRFDTLSFEVLGAIQSSYIQNDVYGTHFIAVVQPLYKGNITNFSPTPAKTLLVDDSLAVVWEGEASIVERPKPFKVVGICGDKYAVAYRKIEDDMPNVMTVELLSKTGATIRNFDHTLIESGRVSKLFLRASNSNPLQLFTNFYQWVPKQEKVGFYGWRGYATESYSVDCDTGS